MSEGRQREHRNPPANPGITLPPGGLLRWGRRTQRRLLRLLARFKLPKATALVIVAILVGVITGLGSVAFIRVLEFSTRLFFDGGRWLFSALRQYYVILVPTVGGLLVGPVIFALAREAKGHGVPEVMSVLILRGGRIRDSTPSIPNTVTGQSDVTGA